MHAWIKLVFILKFRESITIYSHNAQKLSSCYYRLHASARVKIFSKYSPIMIISYFTTCQKSPPTATFSRIIAPMA